MRRRSEHKSREKKDNNQPSSHKLRKHNRPAASTGSDFSASTTIVFILGYRVVVHNHLRRLSLLR